MVSIVNYKMGNIRSIQNALSYLGVDSRVIDSPEEILTSKKLILPGVGSFRVAMEHIRAMKLFEALNEAALKQGVPLLGICLGMQLLATEGEEEGPTKGFGWIPGRVKRFSPERLSIKVPHIGFNTVYFEPKSKTLFEGLETCADFYFVHSYRMICEEPEKCVSSWADYGERFVASVEHRNIFGTQFHPEKSQSNGLTVLKNFCAI
ncbi:MAG: imidazole glycerol phosphate synthase subunit HisH [Candidatus Omnitrophica bacterium]|nr:imidazole glycerol phosphate synthase subunit HisH [Candidatus Omnitrophota bacterium]